MDRNSRSFGAIVRGSKNADGAITTDTSSSSSSSTSTTGGGELMQKQVSFGTIDTEDIASCSVVYYDDESDYDDDQLWYTNRELQKFQEDFIINYRSYQRHMKLNRMKNKMEIAWRKVAAPQSRSQRNNSNSSIIKQ